MVSSYHPIYNVTIALAACWKGQQLSKKYIIIAVIEVGRSAVYQRQQGHSHIIHGTQRSLLNPCAVHPPPPPPLLLCFPSGATTATNYFRAGWYLFLFIGDTMLVSTLQTLETLSSNLNSCVLLLIVVSNTLQKVSPLNTNIIANNDKLTSPRTIPYSPT